jgi:hypothetical protein
MYKLPPAERGRNILHERHKRDTYDIHRKKVSYSNGAIRCPPCCFFLAAIVALR